MTDFDAIIAGLRAGTIKHDMHVRAAVDLLIKHGFWLRRRPDFLKACVRVDDDGTAWIGWDRAREYVDSDASLNAGDHNRAMLDMAVAIGENRYRFYTTGNEDRLLIVTAVAAALGVKLAKENSDE